MMTIEPYRPADLTAWIDLLNLQRSSPLSVSFYLQREVTRPRAETVARLVGAVGLRICGIAEIAKSPYVPASFLRATLIVEPSHRNAGYGSQLLLSLEQCARDSGFEGLVCEQDLQTDKASSWLVKRGFHIAVRRRSSRLSLRDKSLDSANIQTMTPEINIEPVPDTEDGWKRTISFLRERLAETPDLRDLPPWTPELVEDVFRRGPHARSDWVVRATNAGDTLGIAAMHEQGDDAYIYFVGVSPRARNQKIGTALLGRLIDLATRAGRRYVNIDNMESNLAALRINDKLGFMPVSIRLELRKALS